MKNIILINGEEAFVDDCDFEKLIGPRWFCSNRQGLLYARRNVKGVLNKKVLMHREILGLTDPKIYVDHIDGNGLNNQRNNLRICTQSGNMGNRSKNKKGSSRFKGVSKRDNKWLVQVQGRNVGRFDSEVEAALAYNVAASFAFKEFAKLNEVPL